MLGYIIRRLLQLIPVLFGISLITFTLSFIVPGDPVRAIMGQRSDREAELRIRQKFGLDRPWYVQYGLWVRNLIRNPGALPQIKMRIDTENGPATYQFNLTRSTLLATDGQIREVTSQPFQRKVITHLYERGCAPPSDASVSGGTTFTLKEIDTKSSPPRFLLQDFQGNQTWFNSTENLDICSGVQYGGIDLATLETPYTAWFRFEGLQTGRDMTAIYDTSERVVIDAMFDDASKDHSELRNLSPPRRMTITSRESRNNTWSLTFINENRESETHEMLPNAVLILGGNRSDVQLFTEGMAVNVALTTKMDTTLYALYDVQSAELSEIESVRKEHLESGVSSGTITDTILTPAVWFDFGRSYRQQREVRDIIHGSFKNTAYLTIVAMLIAILAGITAGIISAVKPYSIIDYITMTIALIGVSMPVFWLGLMLILLFQGQLGWVKGIGFGEIKWIEVNLLLFSFHLPWHQNVILPSITLATVPMAIIARMTRSSMLEVMNLDYIRTARAKGLSEWTVIIRHALKNSLIPILTVIGVNFALLLAGAVLTETVFSWPGLGREIVDAIEFRDFPVVMAGVVLFAFVFVMVNLVVDILYALVDPRIRYQ